MVHIVPPLLEGPRDRALFRGMLPSTKTVLTVAFVLLFVALAAAAPATSDIVVSTSSDASDGDTATVAALLARPGQDGISLREAIEATNNDPGTYTIRFAPALTERRSRSALRRSGRSLEAA